MAKYQPKIGRQEIARTIAEKHGLSMTRAEEIMGTVVQEMFTALSEGVCVTFTNFGSIKPHLEKGVAVWSGGYKKISREYIEPEYWDARFWPADRLRFAMNDPKARQVVAQRASGRGKPRNLTRYDKAGRKERQAHGRRQQ